MDVDKAMDGWYRGVAVRHSSAQRLQSAPARFGTPHFDHRVGELNNRGHDWIVATEHDNGYSFQVVESDGTPAEPHQFSKNVTSDRRFGTPQEALEHGLELNPLIPPLPSDDDTLHVYESYPGRWHYVRHSPQGQVVHTEYASFDLDTFSSEQDAIDSAHLAHPSIAHTLHGQERPTGLPQWHKDAARMLSDEG